MKKLIFSFSVIALVMLVMKLSFSQTQTDTLTITNKSGGKTKVAVHDISKITLVNMSGVKEATANSNNNFSIVDKYPNPFINEVNIKISVGDASALKITVYDIVGRIIKSNSYKVSTKGECNIKWDGRNDAGDKVRSGIYFYNIADDKSSNTVKLFKVE